MSSLSALPHNHCWYWNQVPQKGNTTWITLNGIQITQDVQRLIPLQPVMAVSQSHLYLLDPEILLRIQSQQICAQMLGSSNI